MKKEPIKRHVLDFDGELIETTIFKTDKRKHPAGETFTVTIKYPPVKTINMNIKIGVNYID